MLVRVCVCVSVFACVLVSSARKYVDVSFGCAQVDEASLTEAIAACDAFQYTHEEYSAAVELKASIQALDAEVRARAWLRGCVL